MSTESTEKSQRELTCCRNAQRALDGLQLIVLHQTGMRHVANIQLALLQIAAHILGTEAVTNTTNTLAAVLAPHVLQNGVDGGLGLLNSVLAQPGHEVKICGLVIQRDGITVEQVRHDDEVPAGSEQVRDELGIVELVADHISQDEDSILGGLVCRVGEVRRDWIVNTAHCAYSGVFTVVNVLELALGLALVQGANSAAMRDSIGGHFEICDVITDEI